jgi:hydrogenase nickel incorporation protein HypA/HybF
MHELGYCAGVLEAVERRAAGRRVARVGVSVGALHRVSPAAFDQSFRLLADGGVAAGAATEVEIVPSRATCRQCSATFETAEPAPACPECHSSGVETEGGDELILQWVEYAGPAEGARPRGEPAGGVRAAAGEDH